MNNKQHKNYYYSLEAIPREGILSYLNGLELLEESLKLGADVI